MRAQFLIEQTGIGNDVKTLPQIQHQTLDLVLLILLCFATESTPSMELRLQS